MHAFWILIHPPKTHTILSQENIPITYHNAHAQPAKTYTLKHLPKIGEVMKIYPIENTWKQTCRSCSSTSDGSRAVASDWDGFRLRATLPRTRNNRMWHAASGVVAHCPAPVRGSVSELGPPTWWLVDSELRVPRCDTWRLWGASWFWETPKFPKTSISWNSSILQVH